MAFGSRSPIAPSTSSIPRRCWNTWEARPSRRRTCANAFALHGRGSFSRHRIDGSRSSSTRFCQSCIGFRNGRFAGWYSGSGSVSLPMKRTSICCRVASCAISSSANKKRTRSALPALPCWDGRATCCWWAAASTTAQMSDDASPPQPAHDRGAPGGQPREPWPSTDEAAHIAAADEQERLAPCVGFRHLRDLERREIDAHRTLALDCVAVCPVEQLLPPRCFACLGGNAVFRCRLFDQHEIVLEGVASPEVPVFELLHVFGKATVALVETAVEQDRLDRKIVVVPECESVERLMMPRRVRNLFVLPLLAVDDVGKRFPGKRVGALQVARPNRVQ